MPGNTTKFKRKDPSSFYDQILTLVNETEINLEDEEPILRAWLWYERKEQIALLKITLDRVLTDPLRDDYPLYVVCQMMFKKCRTALLSGYNDFKVELEKILDTITPEQMNLPTKEEREEYYRVTFGKTEGKGTQSKIISEAKLALSRELSAPDALKLIESKLAEIKVEGKPLEEIFRRLVSLAEQKLYEKFSNAVDQLQGIIQEYQTESHKMKISFDALCEQLKEVYGLLLEFKERYPMNFALLCKTKKLSPALLEKFQGPRTPGELVAQRGLLRRCGSDGALTALPRSEADATVPWALPGPIS